jgi:single-strand DNA-binding protein
MASLNKVLLLGNLTRDPELRYAPNGTAVARFGLAINSRYRQGEEWKDDVCFVDVVVFGRQAETAGEYLSKGRMALIEGRLQWRSWEGQDGQKRSKHEVIAERVQFLSRGREEGVGRSSPEGSDSGGEIEMSAPEDDDIPFVRSDISDEVFAYDRKKFMA